MGKGTRIRRGKRYGKQLPEQKAGMSAIASHIAVSEMTGFPAEKICNWVLVSWSHTDNGTHLLSLISPCMMVDSEPEYGKLIILLEKALGDAKQLEREAAN